MRKHLRASDLRGLAQLATQATTGVAQIVEGVHRSVLSTAGLVSAQAEGTRGITGLVYRSIGAVTRRVGKGVDAALLALQPLLESALDTAPETAQREAVLAALNGVMGDRLAAHGSPFATRMSLRCRGAALDRHTTPFDATRKVVVLVHGLCMNDLQWRAMHRGERFDHGTNLAALGYTPLYLRYNTGMHISQNGRELAAQLEAVTTQWPVPIERLSVVAHSMGGLVMRAACHYGRESGMHWPERLKHLVFLGTPHHGAPLERAGNAVDVVLGSTRWSAPFAKLAQLRSAGITDLRYGHVLDQDWQGRDRFRRHPDRRARVPLPPGVATYTVAATTAAKRSVLADRLIGDGLVPLHSALGRHDDASRTLSFAPDAQWIAYRTNHMELLSRPEVGERLAEWLRR
ncbi:MAG: GPI inositol-deacylase [Chiayiivirga sp.]|jgi:pimeloyl-ACP methyl ester carboxylesterase|uniref:esterase/lipase family protein n=1 Tax=Chiayiivirga sp. TaxID=2041042 RepID=UPI0025BD49B2|nr:hypothetical protein [Chiayiivirga sp.]MCI1710031.1 GPI inositol-deacylase [Chiayiivirga sp.]MCI1730456.1 GPI inositol-deacylase [Chiayiivirga sp.]